MADTKLFLGDFQFDGYEIPESMPFGGSQSLVTHRLPGGSRVVQAMGRDDAPIGWSGLFFGATALDRAKFVDGLRIAGKSLPLVYLDFSYTVLIESFTATVRKFNRVPYSISLLVLEDKSQPVTTIEPTGFDAAIRGDNATAQTLGASIGDGPLSTALGALDGAIKTVSDFASATSAAVASVVGPAGAVLNRVNTLIGSAGSVVNQVTTLGGVLPGNPIAAQANKILGQVTAAVQMPALVQLRNVANRIQGNLGALSSTAQTRTVTVAGGTLFDIAAQAYGDPTRWTAIAQANKLIDPLLSGVQTLKVPTSAPNTGGVPST